MGKRGPRKGEGGRPPVEINMEVVTRAASIGCTIDEIAALAGVSPRTFDNRLAADEHFHEQVEIARGQGRATLRRYQWHQASRGNTAMLIWLGKNMLGQVDRREYSGPGGEPMEMIVTGVRRGPEIDGNASDVSTGVQRSIGGPNGDD